MSCYMLDQVKRSEMGDCISELPDDVLCYILSFLTVRDAVRTRSLSRRWRYLPYRCPTVLRFDALNVLGNERYSCVSHQSKFVRLVDHLMDTFTLRPSVLKLQFHLDKLYSSNIDTWIVRFVTMGIKELDLFIPNYVFSCYLLCPWMEASSLTCLRLSFCALNLSSCCTSWISQLTTLQMSGVSMDCNDMEFILSSALNVTSLSLAYCCNPTIQCLKVELLGLKKLFIEELLMDLKLNCPNLEVFEFTGRLSNITLAHLPFLRQAKVFPNLHRDGGSLIFAELIRFAPHLKALSFSVMTVVQVQPLPFEARTINSSLKQLDLLMFVPYCFDLFSITYFINACPSLEILRLKLKPGSDPRQSPEKEYPDCQHNKLKEVEIDGHSERFNSLELALYLLRNAVALEKMVIVCPDRINNNKARLTTLLQNANSSVELIIQCFS